MRTITESDSVTWGAYFRTRMTSKGFNAYQVSAALREPRAITPVTAHPGQWRWCGGGVAVIGRWEADHTLALVTIYADRVVTARRDDQTDEAARNSKRLNGR